MESISILSFNTKPNRTQNLNEQFLQHYDDHETRRSFMVIEEESFSFKATQVRDLVALNNKIKLYFHDNVQFDFQLEFNIFIYYSS